MNYICINGSPRKNMNTAALLQAGTDELKTLGHSVKTYNIYDLDFKGCYSCFACKKEGKKSYGRCTIKDDLYDIFEEIREADGVIIGSPIYFQDITAQLRAFIERWLFQSFIYSNPPRSSLPNRKKAKLIYTMNIPKSIYDQNLTKDIVENLEEKISFLFGDTSSYKSFDTNQLNDYKGIEYSYFDPEYKLKKHKDEFYQEIENVRHFISNW